MKLHEILDPENRGLLYTKMLHRSDLFARISVHYDGATEGTLSGLYIETLLGDVERYVAIALYETNEEELDVWVSMDQQDIQLGVYDTITEAIEAIRVIHQDVDKWMDEHEPDKQEDE